MPLIPCTREDYRCTFQMHMEPPASSSSLVLPVGTTWHYSATKSKSQLGWHLRHQNTFHRELCGPQQMLCELLVSLTLDYRPGTETLASSVPCTDKMPTTWSEHTGVNTEPAAVKDLKTHTQPPSAFPEANGFPVRDVYLYSENQFIPTMPGLPLKSP